MKTLDELGTSPAPWWAKNVYVIDMRGCVVASVPIIGNPQKTADARLIAAAPELYEALRQLVDYLSLNDWTDRELDPFIEAADNALAAASGESEEGK